MTEMSKIISMIFKGKIGKLFDFNLLLSRMKIVSWNNANNANNANDLAKFLNLDFKYYAKPINTK